MRLRLEALTVKEGWEFKSERPPMIWARSCDKASGPLTVLLAMAEKEVKEGVAGGCVFGDLFDGVPAVPRAWISSAEAPEGASSADIKAANLAIDASIASNAAWIYPQKATSWCHSHERQCPAHPCRDPEAVPGQQLHVNIAGVSCLPWSSEGSQLGDSMEKPTQSARWLIAFGSKKDA